MEDWRDTVVLSMRDAQEVLIAMEEDAATTGIDSPSRKLVEIVQVLVAELQQIKGIHIPYPVPHPYVNNINAIYGKTAARQAVRDIVGFLRYKERVNPGDSAYLRGYREALRMIQSILDKNGYKEED